MVGDDPDKKKLALQYAADNRKSEISLLWSRALYFWGFVAALFVLYGAAIQYGHRTVAFCAACLGSLCSFCWTLTNRSSKYWQEVWEKKVEEAAAAVGVGHVFPRNTNPKVEEFWFWGPKQFSPSKLVMAASDLVVFAWVMLSLAAIVPRFIDLDTLVGEFLLIISHLFAAIFTVVYAAVIFFWCRSGERLKISAIWKIINTKWRG